ncbi:MAG: hypothetical protein ACI8RA_000967, partial [Chlamydiales bacterium]
SLDLSLFEVLKQFPDMGTLEVSAPFLKLLHEKENQLLLTSSEGLDSEKGESQDSVISIQFPFLGSVSILDGTIVFFEEGVEPVNVEGLNLSLSIPSFDKGLQIRFSGTAQHAADQGSFQAFVSLNGFDEEGNFSLDKGAIVSGVFQEDVALDFSFSMTKLPVMFLDKLTEVRIPELKGLISSILGKEADISCRSYLHSEGMELNLSVQSPLLQGRMAGHSVGNHFSVVEGGAFTLLVSPGLVDKLRSVTDINLPVQLLKETELKFTFKRFTFPMELTAKNFSDLDFDVGLIFSDVDCKLSDQDVSVHLKEVEVRSDSPKKVNGVSSSIHAVALYEDQASTIDGQVYFSDFFDGEQGFQIEKARGRWKWSVQDVPTKLLDLLGNTEGKLESYLGENISISSEGSSRLEHSEMDFILDSDNFSATKFHLFWEGETGKFGAGAKGGYLKDSSERELLLGEDLSFRLNGWLDKKTKGFTSGVIAISGEASSERFVFRWSGEIRDGNVISSSAPAIFEYDFHPDAYQVISEYGSPKVSLNEMGKVFVEIQPFDLNMSKNWMESLKVEGSLKADFLKCSFPTNPLIGGVEVKDIALPWEIDFQAGRVAAILDAQIFGESLTTSEEGGAIHTSVELANAFSQEDLSFDISQVGINAEVSADGISLKVQESREGLSIEEVHLSMNGEKLSDEIRFKGKGRGGWDQQGTDQEIWEFVSEGHFEKILDSKDSRGTFTTELTGKSVHLEIDSELKRGVIFLRQNLNGEVQISHGLGRFIAQTLNPLLMTAISSENALRFELEREGFSLPISPFRVADIVVGNAFFDPGKVVLEKGGPLDGVLQLLRLDKLGKAEQFDVWFTPLYVSMNNGVLTCKRMDALIDNRFPIAAWGDVNILNDDVNMVVGLTGIALKKTLGIKNINEDYLLQLPLKGTLIKPRLETRKAVASIGSLIAKSEGGEVGSIFGGILGMIAERGKRTQVPDPTTEPLPWEALMSKEPVKEVSESTPAEAEEVEVDPRFPEILPFEKFFGN